jgi:hypothetical protein
MASGRGASGVAGGQGGRRCSRCKDSRTTGTRVRRPRPRWADAGYPLSVRCTNDETAHVVAHGFDGLLGVPPRRAQPQGHSLGRGDHLLGRRWSHPASRRQVRSFTAAEASSGVLSNNVRALGLQVVPALTALRPERKGEAVNEPRSSKRSRRTTHKEWRSRSVAVAAALFISTPVVLVGGSATASASTRVVNAPAQVVPGTTSLNGIACHGHDNCVAVGSDSGEGVVVPITDGVPGTAEPVSATDSLTAVSCPTTTYCVAVGTGPYSNPPEPTQTAGYVVPITDGTPTGANVVPGMGMPGAPDQVYLYGVGCISATSCWAVGSSAYLGDVILPIGSQNLEPVAPGYGLQGVACRDNTCIAVGNEAVTSRKYPYGEGIAVAVTDGKAGSLGGSPGTQTLNGVACRFSAWCFAVGSNTHDSTEGVVVLVISQTIRNAVLVPGSAVLYGVGCRHVTQVDCVAVGSGSNQGVVAPIYDGTPGAAHAVAGSDELSGVACPTSTSCLVVGGNSSDEGVLATVRL